MFIPGWAFDCQIFETIDLPYNYLFACPERNRRVVDFEDSLKESLRKQRIEKISLFGWSQGGFLACDFAIKNPDMVNELILVSIRKEYKKEVLENVKGYLKKDKVAYLSRFYQECFCSEESNYFSWFKNRFLEYYLQHTELEELINSLDLLSHMRIDPEPLKRFKRIMIIHGRKDKIAPVDEVIKIKSSLPEAELIIFEDTGHLPFLRADFRERLLCE